MSDHHTGARHTRAATPDREPDPEGVDASAATAPKHEGHTAMNNATTTPDTDRPPDQQSDHRPDHRPDRPGREQALSDRELVALAERCAAATDQGGLDAARAEAERRALDQAPDSLAAQVAGYIGLLAEDPEHALAEEAHAWSLELHRTLDLAGLARPSVPAPRRRPDRAVHS